MVDADEMDEDDSPGVGHNSGDVDPAVLQKMAELEGMSEKELGEYARRRQLQDLLLKLELGQLSHQEHAVLRNLLRDNGFNLMPFNPQPGAPTDPNRAVSTAPPQAPTPLPDLQDPEYDL